MIRWVSADIFNERLNAPLWKRISSTFSLGLFPMMYFLPTSLGLVIFAGLAIKFFAIAKKMERLALVSAIVIMIIGAIMLYLNFYTLGISYVPVALLAILSVCKLLESRNVRDVRALFLLQVLLMVAALMYSQSILMFIYALINLFAALRMLLFLEQRNAPQAKMVRFRELGKLFLLAFPFAAMLFFFVPRIQPLWGVPRPQENSITGLPDEMSLGDMGTLAQSDEIAFRVTFNDGKIPPSRDLYWRGLTLWHFDGTNWTQRRDLHRPAPQDLSYDKNSEIAYTILPAKQDLKWLTPLELPVSYSSKVHLGGSFQIPRPLREKNMRYPFVSATKYRYTQNLPRFDRKEALQLPENAPMPQLRGFSERLFQDNNRDPEQFAAAFLRHLNEEEFYYSLETLPSSRNVENFFFQDRIGFCEHYANAMALSARIVGIPSRVILGYQGGNFNPISQDWVVREEAAHAWVELWIDGKGWVRFDPTASVSPARIMQGRLSRESLTAGNDDRAFVTRMAEDVPALSWLRDVADATESFWQNWVLDLDRDRQEGLLQKLGLSQLGLRAVFGILLLVFVVAGALLFWLWQRRPRENEDAIAKALRKLLFKLEQKGFIKMTSESPAAFFRRLATEVPEKQADLLALAQQYEIVRYHENDNENQLLNLIKRLRF